MNYGVIAAIGTCLAAAVAALSFYTGWVVSRTRGDDAAKSAGEAHGRIDRLGEDLSAFKTEVARDYATSSALEKMETRVVDAINRLGDRLDRWADREERGPPPRRRRSGAGA